MKLTLLVVKLLLSLYLGYLLICLLFSYDPVDPGYRPPFVLFVLDWVNLFVHEAGHFFFRILGQWMYILGGSLFQVLIPLALAFVTWRQNIGQLVYPGFWMGESMVNVSVYIKDAPFKHLKLIGRGLIHDWNWLLSDNLDLADPLGWTVYGLGILTCAASIGAGVYFAVISYQEDIIPET
jgi:hypothetical protein